MVSKGCALCLCSLLVIKSPTSVMDVDIYIIITLYIYIYIFSKHSSSAHHQFSSGYPEQIYEIVFMKPFSAEVAGNDTM